VRSTPALEIEAPDETPGSVVIRGEIDLATGPQVDALLATLLGDIRVECSGVTFVDSAGFRAFDRAYELAVERGDAFVISALPAFPARIARLLRLPYLLEST
jgi:anti-anti-sigma factor